MKVTLFHFNKLQMKDNQPVSIRKQHGTTHERYNNNLKSKSWTKAPSYE